MKRYCVSNSSLDHEHETLFSAGCCHLDSRLDWVPRARLPYERLGTRLAYDNLRVRTIDLLWLFAGHDP